MDYLNSLKPTDKQKEDIENRAVIGESTKYVTLQVRVESEMAEIVQALCDGRGNPRQDLRRFQSRSVFLRLLIDEYFEKNKLWDLLEK